MGSNIFSASLSGMNAAQYALTTTEHNIANANTPGFTRQQVLVSSRAAQASGAGFIGQGVDVAGVQRIYDQFLTTQVRQEQSQSSYLSAYLSAMKQVDNLVADPAAGVSPAMQSFFDAMNGLSSSPESVPARQTVISTAQFAVNRFQAIDQRLTDIADGLTGQIAGSVQSVNTYANQIATLNGNIKRAIAAGQGQPPNDLLDQRDQLVNQLNKEMKVTVQQQTDGAMNVFVGNGQALVIDERA
ncbi:MAG TPA: flagellar hook-associated protein FlgK, partial [Gallionella sp.]|nr:flagellar hook-associated protein FlgK [Gallionella sp.]